ncbi:transposase [Methanosarcina barkeri]|uniref:transposase n=1 Tax=Methanosarcina barkeri TaxID=2208 RepID=UPI0012D39182
MELHRTLSSSAETEYRKASCKLRKLMNGILYVVMTGCTWKNVPRRYGSKSTVHRFHLYCLNMVSIRRFSMNF